MQEGMGNRQTGNVTEYPTKEIFINPPARSCFYT